ncbi:MAG TPA: hypothetical protein VJK52_02860 [Candidatus Nanoarchaeia archaeon]|nr:hypothetical protein [Candidatus Nanoarchaeia archaeon]
MGWKLVLFGGVILVFFVVAMLDRPNTGSAVQSPELCTTDVDCVPAACCHASSCVPLAEAPDCSAIACTQDCRPGTLDCGQMRCGCVSGKCVTKLF